MSLNADCTTLNKAKIMEHKEKKSYTFLRGTPEIHIINLVNRVHSAQECPHKGSCLQEKEMTELLGLYLRGMIAQAKKTEHEKCTIGCPLYNSGHSVDESGHCNMGCC